MRQKPARETDESMKIQQIPHIATADGHNYACREQDPHRYHKTLQNPTKIKKTLNIEIVSAIGGTLFTLTTLLKKV